MDQQIVTWLQSVYTSLRLKLMLCPSWIATDSAVMSSTDHSLEHVRSRVPAKATLAQDTANMLVFH